MKTEGLVALPSFIFPDRTRKLASAGLRPRSHRTEGLQAIQAPTEHGTAAGCRRACDGIFGFRLGWSRRGGVWGGVVVAMKSDVMAVVDFETTGLSPGEGARAIEIAAVLVSGDRVVDSYSSLMNPGVSVPPEITQLTGITTKMVRSAPPAAAVMKDVTRFVGDAALVAHNASFDRRFLEAEHRRIGVSRRLDFVCTMLLSRRIFDGAPNHKLGTLVRHLGLPADGALHRALSDATVTAELLFRIQAEISARYGLSLPHKALARVQRAPRKNLEKVMAALEKAGPRSPSIPL